MPHRPSLAAWMTQHVRPTDGPGTGTRLALEPWQRGFLTAVDRERKPIVSLMASSQLRRPSRASSSRRSSGPSARDFVERSPGHTWGGWIGLAASGSALAAREPDRQDRLADEV